MTASLTQWIVIAALINFSVTTFYLVDSRFAEETKAAEEAVQSASKFEKVGDWKSAIENYEIVVSDYATTPYAAKALYRLARIDLRHHFDITAARDKLLEVIDQYPYSPEARQARPDVAFIEDHWDHDGKPLKLWYQASAHNRNNDPKAALTTLTELVGSYPDAKLVPIAFYRIGRVLEEQGRKREAIEAYQEVIRRAQDSKEADDALQRQLKLANS